MIEIAFTKVKLPYGWLGNMSPYPIKHKGKEWRTTEALFQALRFDNEKIQEEIRAQKSPMAAKLIAKRQKEDFVIEPLEKQDLQNMQLCIKLKIEQHSELQEFLIVTNDAIIIEDCTKRGKRGSNLFWGAILTENGWEGKNHLGKIWMNLRKELRSTKILVTKTA